MASLARWCFRHRRLVLLLWIVALIGLGGISQAAGNDYKDAFSLPGTDSQKAIDLLQRDFPAASGDSATIVLHSRTGAPLTDPALRGPATEMLDKLATLPHVSAVHSPFERGGETQISKSDGLTAFASVDFDQQGIDLPKDDIQTFVDTARSSDSSSLQVEATGQLVAVIEQQEQSYSELIGIVAAAVILFLAFGSLLAVTLPLITAIIALGVGSMLIILFSHVITIAEFSPILATLIGLGVGIDYALFIVNRHRIGLRAGKSPEEAAVTAVNTSGRAVLFAGITVCIALLGMFALGVSFLYGVAISAAVVVAMTMFAAVTLLPALLGFYGMRVLNRRDRRRLAEDGPEHASTSGFWWNWAKRIERRPQLFAVVSGVVILVIAVPFFSLRLGSSDLGNGDTSKTTKRGYDLLADGFGPGFNGPFSLVAEIRSPQDKATFDAVVRAARTTPGVASVSEPRESPKGQAEIATLYPTTSPQAEDTSKLLHRLRDDVVPQANQTNTGIYIGGITAIFEDFSSTLSDKLPLFIGVVVVLAFLLLVAVFRSLLIPLTASVMNLLAVGASFGIVVAVFQWGWGSSVFSVTGGPVEAFIPVILFAILFGLSMDYEVFLVSRMHEEWTARRDNQLAVSLGQAETGRVISAAGGIMTLVFASFILGDDRVIKLMGLGLASAIVIDAFIIRTVLVPSLMHVFGRANWWVPSWLDRILPRISVEAAEDIEEIRHTPLPADALPAAAIPIGGGHVHEVPGQAHHESDAPRAGEPTH
ncbi:putative RND superfamily drug exporter [Frankia canadensis]|uniref:Putative RND superfamily drug exporter n=1 Tax=Frankia canadensis TaxID=1836972 RepID=A0A2I2KL95_9ACTN|nr:MMPL family transporter [Frankia canadensis]SNQ46440.1 putative RND superfamily drug exporter [Frankia canadensis]SOU53730.1 putative RND superfamily drug exporter [Frankia canadensis]